MTTDPLLRLRGRLLWWWIKAVCTVRRHPQTVTASGLTFRTCRCGAYESVVTDPNSAASYAEDPLGGAW